MWYVSGEEKRKREWGEYTNGNRGRERGRGGKWEMNVF